MDSIIFVVLLVKTTIILVVVLVNVPASMHIDSPQLKLLGGMQADRNEVYMFYAVNVWYS